MTNATVTKQENISIASTPSAIIELTNCSRYFGLHDPYHPYDPYLYREDLIPELRMTITVTLSGKDSKDRKHGVVQTFWIYEVIVDCN